MLKQASPKPSINEHSKATQASGGLKKPTSFVSSNGDLLGRFKRINTKLAKWIMNPIMTMGSRPYLTVFDPSKPNRIPPNTSPMPIQIPDKPTNCLADSPIASVNPILELYTPLKNDSSKPMMIKRNYIWQIYRAFSQCMY